VGKYSAEWWEKNRRSEPGLPAQDPVDVVDHLIQATAHGARLAGEKCETAQPGAGGSKRERSLAD
jgi:hypothetical protein